MLIDWILDSCPGNAFDALNSIRDTLQLRCKNLHRFGIQYKFIHPSDMERLRKQTTVIAESSGIGLFQISLERKVNVLLHSPRVTWIWSAVRAEPRTLTYQEAYDDYLEEEAEAAALPVMDEETCESLIAAIALVLVIAMELCDLRDSDPDSADFGNVPDGWQEISCCLLESRPSRTKPVAVRDIDPDSDPALGVWLGLISPFFECVAEGMSASIKRFKTQSQV